MIDEDLYLFVGTSDEKSFSILSGGKPSSAELLAQFFILIFANGTQCDLDYPIEYMSA